MRKSLLGEVSVVISFSGRQNQRQCTNVTKIPIILVRQPPTEAIAMDDERQRGNALWCLVEKRIRIVIEWLQLNVRFLAYLSRLAVL